MTDQEKKSLRSFLKEMESMKAIWTRAQANHTPFSHADTAASATIKTIEAISADFVERFSEDLYPTCERCNLPVSDEDKVEEADMHRECYIEWLKEE